MGECRIQPTAVSPGVWISCVLWVPVKFVIGGNVNTCYLLPGKNSGKARFLCEVLEGDFILLYWYFLKYTLFNPVDAEMLCTIKILLNC